MRKFISTIFVLLWACTAFAAAEPFSYLYIQGDKKTPFYVKLEDAMQPRYGKNYCIIPRLAPGPAHIEILFQQHAFPAQQFTVLIPESGSRGFLLVQKDGAFSLYDLQQGFYLPASNASEDDHLPTATSTVAANKQQASKAVDEPPVRKAASADEAPGKTALDKLGPFVKKPAAEIGAPVVKSEEPATGNPVFIRDIELSKGEQRDSGGVLIMYPSGNATQVAISNSDCPAPLTAAAFGKIFTALSAFTEDEERLEYLGGQMTECYETWQARTLAGKLAGDAARYELLKKIYPRITDQSAFPLLDDLLTTEIWKAEFLRLVHR